MEFSWASPEFIRDHMTEPQIWAYSHWVPIIRRDRLRAQAHATALAFFGEKKRG